MKQFFKFVTASCLGSFLALGVLLLVFMLIGLISSLGGGIENNTVLRLDLRNAIPEKTNNVVQDDFDFGGEDYMGLREMTRVIDHAATDKQIKGIVLNSRGAAVGQSTLSSVIEAINKFKESGKFVYSYADQYTQSGYLLASCADSIFLNPNGAIDMVGYGSMTPFFTPFMKKMGIDAEVYYAGKFKSATEPIRRENMSPENKLQTRSFLNDMLDVYQNTVSTHRGIPLNKVEEIMNEYAGVSSKSCLQNNLIDGIIYRDSFENLVRNELGLKAKKKISYIDLDSYKSQITLSSKSSSKNKIAVVFAEGEVGYDNKAPGGIDDLRYIETFDKIRRDKKVKAVVIRVNSPGGSALTSDIIWNEIESLKEDGIPVIASMGDYAASGGYYIACNSDSILAAPNTLTGSIGVFSIIPKFRGLADQIGVKFDTVKTHDFALINNIILESTPEEARLMQKYTDELYVQFKSRVADGRNMTIEEVDEIAQGRVWSGSKALEIGLVDKLGGLDDAIAMAARNADLDGYKIVEYPKIKENPYKAIIKAMNAEVALVKADLLPSEEARTMIKKAKEIESLLQTKGPMARLPLQYLIN